MLKLTTTLSSHHVTSNGFMAQQWVYGAAKWRKHMMPVFMYSMNLGFMAYGALHSDHTFKLGLMAQRCL